MLVSGHDVFLSFTTRSGPASPRASGRMLVVETVIYRFKHWYRQW